MTLRVRFLMPVLVAAGCASIREPLPEGFRIADPPAVPQVAATVSNPVSDPSTGTLELREVLDSLQRSFPLLTAAEQERILAAGNRLSAEGAFDTTLRMRGANRDGTFDNSTLDASFEQPLGAHGINTFAGYRFGLGEFPVYSGGLKTAAGGEFRAGLLLPLLKDGPIDRRRAVLRQAQIGLALADPTVQRVAIDAYRAARRGWFAWVAAGEQVVIAERFVDVAKQRADVIEERTRRGAASELDAAQARQVLAEREGRRFVAKQRWQQAVLDLSLVYRTSGGEPLLAGVERLPKPISTLEPPRLDPDGIVADTELARTRRPELRRIQLQKERAAIDLKLAQNQMQPALNLGVAAAQDVGPSGSKTPNTGIFALDRTAAEAFLTYELPAQRREARGRAMAATALLNQLIQQERYARDQVAVEVRGIYIALQRDLDRLAAARTELANAAKVVDIARQQYETGAIRLFELNSLEVVSLDAQSKVVEILLDYYRTQADYRAALGVAAE